MRLLVAGVVLLAFSAAAGGSGVTVVRANGVALTVPAGWHRVAVARDGAVTDPRTLVVVGTRGVEPKPTRCQIAAYRVPAGSAVVVVVGWKTAGSGGGRMEPGRAPLKQLVSVHGHSFECFAGRGAAADLTLGVHAYQVNVMVGDRATRTVVDQALAIGRSFAVIHQAAARLVPRMEKTPAYVLAYCRSAVHLRPECPYLLPRMEGAQPHWDTNVCQAEKDGCRGAAFDVLDLVDAGYGEHPPVWSHITFFAGNLTSAFPFRFPTRGTRPATIDGLFGKPHPEPTFLASFNWGGRHGTLILAPEFPTGGQQGDHLIFRWRESGMSYALGLHGWEPLTDAVATLRAMVVSTR